MRQNDDEYGTTDWLASIRLQEVEEEPWKADRSDCPDCAGQGYGCCINADIPLPGVER